MDHQGGRGPAPGVHFETQADGSPWPVVDATAISKALTPVAKAVKLPAVSASYLKARNGKVVGVTPDKPGHKLDPAAMTTAIAKLVEDRAGFVTAANVKVRLAPVAPKLTTEQASRTAPVMQHPGDVDDVVTRSATATSSGRTSGSQAQLIDGTVMRPGQTSNGGTRSGRSPPARGFGPGS